MSKQVIPTIGGGVIVDRRGESSNKHIGERLKKREDEHLRKKIQEVFQTRSISDADKKAEVTIKRTIREPTFHTNPSTGERDIVLPGNDKYVVGDTIGKPKKGGGGGGKGSPDGEGEDEYTYTFTREEIREYLFDDLELPDMAQKTLTDSDETMRRPAGVTKAGNPSMLHIQRTYKSALSRRLASGGSREKKLDALYVALEELRTQRGYMPPEGDDDPEIVDILEQIKRIEARTTPRYLDVDARYRASMQVPAPTTKAVMFCILDVSGSMTQVLKDTAKKFFILLHWFLHVKYKRVEVVFIRHHTSAREVSEEVFFTDRDTGGTVVSSALYLMRKIIAERYATGWNIYGAQASDGDNWTNDSPICGELLLNDLLPKMRHYAYIELAKESQDLWKEYNTVYARCPERRFDMRRVAEPRDIFPVFHDLFKKRT